MLPNVVWFSILCLRHFANYVGIKHVMTCAQMIGPAGWDPTHVRRDVGRSAPTTFAHS